MLAKKMNRSMVAIIVLLSLGLTEIHAKPVDIGSRRELFVDYHLIDKLTDTGLVRQTPTDEGAVIRFDQPWEGILTGATTIIKDGPSYRLYYRGQPVYNGSEVTCYAESSDGINWTRPNLGLVEIDGSTNNNVILENTHAFAPFIDTKPGIPAGERYKAVNPQWGSRGPRLAGWVSPDGINWTKAHDSIFRGFAFDTMNLAFYSEAEQQYVCYFRDWKDGIRRIRRATGSDFSNFTDSGLMEYAYNGQSVPLEHHYLPGTNPYFRAPHIYIALVMRFFPNGGCEVAPEQVEELGIDPSYYAETCEQRDESSDCIFMTTRCDSQVYDRPFTSKYIEHAPDIGPQMSRSDSPTVNVVQTGPTEMSFYVLHNYASTFNHLRRYSLRLDGFVAVSSGSGTGEMITKPLVFEGNRLYLNYLAHTCGSLKVEIQEIDGTPVPGYTLSDAIALTSDEIDREVYWTQGSDVSKLAGKPIRLRVKMRSADLYALQFVEMKKNGECAKPVVSQNSS